MINGLFRRSIALIRPNGDLDDNFRVRGLSTFPIFAMAVQPDGKILVCHSSLERFNPDGSRDTTFSSLEMRQLAHDVPYYRIVLPQADGKIIVAGSFAYIGNPFRYRPGVARFNRDGSLDNSFAPPPEEHAFRFFTAAALDNQQRLVLAWGNGLLRLTESGLTDTTFNYPSSDHDFGAISAIAVQPDGKILIAGSFYDNATNLWALARLNSDGSGDKGFSFVPSKRGGELFLGKALDLDRNGKILLAGTIGTDVESSSRPFARGRLHIEKFESDGKPDAKFIAPSLPSEPIRAAGTLKLASLSSGEIVFASPLNGLILRLNSDGTIEKKYAVDTAAPQVPLLIAVDKSGGLLVYGQRGTNLRSRLIRSFPDGTIDEAYARNTENLTGSYFPATLLLRDGRLLINTFESPEGFVRLNADGTRDNGFLVSSSGVAPTVIAETSDGRLVFGRANNFDGNRLLWRALPNGTDDKTFKPELGDDVRGILSLTAVGQRLLVGGFRTYDRFLRRLNDDGSLDATFDSGDIGGPAAVQSTGKIIVLTQSQNVKRIEINGEEDQTFKSDFQGEPRVPDDSTSVAVGPDDSIYVMSPTRITRLSPDGIRDQYFPPLGAYWSPKVVSGTGGEAYLSGVFDGTDGFSFFSIARLRPAPLLQITRNGSFLSLLVPAPIGASSSMVLESSTDLVDWKPTLTNQTSELILAPIQDARVRFYRAAVLE